MYLNSCGNSIYLTAVVIHMIISYRSLAGLMPLRIKEEPQGHRGRSVAV